MAIETVPMYLNSIGQTEEHRESANNAYVVIRSLYKLILCKIVIGGQQIGCS